MYLQLHHRREADPSHPEDEEMVEQHESGAPPVSYHDLSVVRELQAEVVALHKVEVVAHGVKQNLPRRSLLWTERTGVTSVSAESTRAHKPRCS